MYAKPGLHPYIIPFGILKDETDKGPLWDPALNYYGYDYTIDPGHDIGVRWASDGPEKFSERTDTLAPTSNTPNAPVTWFHYSGHWGDKFYPLSDKRQYRFFTEWAHVSGPPGPKFKAPGRPNICFKTSSCTVLSSIEPLHWFLRMAKDWLTVCIVVWLAVVGIWTAIAGFRHGWACCAGLRRKLGRPPIVDGSDAGSGEGRSLLTGARMANPLNYGGVGTSRMTG